MKKESKKDQEKAEEEEEKKYEELRSNVISKYGILYKDSLAMDACEVPKALRLRILKDPVYLSKTKALKANLFAQQLGTLDSVLAGAYTGGKDINTSDSMLKALALKNKLLFEDLNVNKDETTALNVAFISMDKANYEALDTVTIKEGGNSTDLGADFGVNDDEDSFEARLKEKTDSRLKKLGLKGGNNATD